MINSVIDCLGFKMSTNLIESIEKKPSLKIQNLPKEVREMLSEHIKHATSFSVNVSLAVEVVSHGRHRYASVDDMDDRIQKYFLLSRFESKTPCLFKKITYSLSYYEGKSSVTDIEFEEKAVTEISASDLISRFGSMYFNELVPS